MSQPYLGRCKSCDYTIFATPEDIAEVPEFSGVKSGGAYRITTRNATFSRCDKGHTVFLLKQIKGTYSKDHKCDSRCLNAKGHNCTCSCGGANHGRGHAVTVHEAASKPSVEIRRGILPPTPDKRSSGALLGSEGEKIEEQGKVISRSAVGTDSVLYVILTRSLAKVKWFVPEQYDPDFPVGKELEFRAKVKRHEEHEVFGNSTIVIYLEEI